MALGEVNFKFIRKFGNTAEQCAISLYAGGQETHRIMVKTISDIVCKHNIFFNSSLLKEAFVIMS